MKKGEKIRKSNKDKKIFGVCGGIAEYFEIDPLIIRVIWGVLSCFYGVGILLYFIFALAMPDAEDE